jgi:hypothetical protein
MNMNTKDSPQSRKRSSLKTSNIFPENITLEQFLEMNKAKHIKWDNKVVVEDQPVAMEELETDDKHKDKYKIADTHYQDPVTKL